MYLTVKWQEKVMISICCNLGVAWFELFDNIASSSFWSVSKIKWQAYRKWWDFIIAQATASDSLSMATYLSGLLQALYLQNNHAFLLVTNKHQDLFVIVSVCNTVCFLGLQYSNMGALEISCFICVKADWCSGPQLKGILYFVLWQFSN